MLDYLFALGQFSCVIGLLYGLILSVVNYKYSSAPEHRYGPATGDEWNGQVPQDALVLTIVPTAGVVSNSDRGLQPTERTKWRIFEDQLPEH